MYKPKDSQDNSLHLLCLFLAEEMRMRMISLGSAKEIARHVLANKNLIDNEEHLLKLMAEMSKDFPQLKRFEVKLAVYLERQGKTDAERKVAQFVETVIAQDQKLALSILDEAIDSDNSLDELKKKFPQFADFLEQQK